VLQATPAMQAMIATSVGAAFEPAPAAHWALAHVTLPIVGF